jgi:hypothetical protein
MKKLLLALLLALASAVPAASQPSPGSGQLVICNKTFQVSQGAVALTKIVSGVSGTSINICGYVANAGAAAATFSLSYGTGTNCGTGTTTIVPVFALGINGSIVDHQANANVAIPSVNASAVPNDLCLVTTGTGPLAIVVYYAQ